LMLCRPAERYVASRPILSGEPKQPSSGALPFSHIGQPCHLTTGAEGLPCLAYSQKFQHLMSRHSKFRPWTLCNSLRTPKRQKKLVTGTFATVHFSWFGLAYTYGCLVKQSTVIRMYRIPLSLYGNGPAMSMAILSNGAPTLYWYIRSRLLARGPRLAAQVLHCWHQISTSLLECSQKYRCLNLSSFLFTPRCPPDGPPRSSVSTSFTLLRGRTFCAASSFRPATPSYAPARHLSLLGIFTAPSCFCRWIYGQRCLYNQDVAQPPFPVDLPHVVIQLLPSQDGTVPTVCSSSSCD
jgi:hypothetical protein